MKVQHIPKIGDAVLINSPDYIGEATVTYIDQTNLYNHHFYPIQTEIEEADLDKLDEFNSGQQMYRTNLKQIAIIGGNET